MKGIKYTALLIIAAVLFSSCTSEKAPALNTYDFLSMDTVFSLRTGDSASDSDKSLNAVFEECEALTKELEGSLSATLDGAEVNSFNAEIDVMLDLDPTLYDVLTVAIQISELTDGAYDPALGALTELWNIKGKGPVPSEDQIKSALSLSGIDRITLGENELRKSNPAVKLDLGGIGKGYAAQKIAEKLFESGVSYGIVSAGRNVGVFGEKPDGTPFKIGIADPNDPSGVVGYIYTESGFVSVTGDYEQFFEENGVRYHHIIDPTTGYPSSSGVSSVAVLSKNGATADALSTALMVMGYEKSVELYNSGSIPFEAVFIMSDGNVKQTDGLSDKQFVLSESYSINSTVQEK